MKKMVPIPEIGWHVTKKEFIEDVKSGCLIDYDGFGLWATETEMLDDHTQLVWPSDIIKGKRLRKLRQYSHIVWFNR